MTAGDREKLVEEIVSAIERKTAPGRMSLSDAHDLIGSLISELEIRLDGISCDIENQAGDRPGSCHEDEDEDLSEQAILRR